MNSSADRKCLSRFAATYYEINQAWPDSCNKWSSNPQIIMLNWTFTFLILALVSGILGFTSLAGSAAGISQTLFALFIGLIIVSLFNEERRRKL